MYSLWDQFLLYMDEYNYIHRGETKVNGLAQTMNVQLRQSFRLKVVRGLGLLYADVYAPLM